MRKLMRANFYRLWKSRVFWICVAASFLISAAFLLAKQYPSQEMPSLDEMYLQIFPMLPLIHGVFAGLFLGTEYQDGTLRNKVTVGHTRGEIYLSFLAVCLCAGLGILLGWLYEKQAYYFNGISQDLRIIGYMIPGLLANDMCKQGIWRTVLMVLVIALLIRLIMTVGMYI